MTLQFLVMWILMAFSGIFFYTSVLAIRDFIKIQKRRKTYAYLEAATESNTCKGPHAWDQMKLSMPPLPVGQYRICKECGFVAYEDSLYKLNKPALEIYKKNLTIMYDRIDASKVMNIRLQNEANKIMYRLIRNNVEMFEGDLQLNTERLKNFFLKTKLELDSMYSSLSKELDDTEPHG